MNTLDELLKIVNRYIGEQKYSRKPWNLYEPIEYDLMQGGKRVLRLS